MNGMFAEDLAKLIIGIMKNLYDCTLDTELGSRFGYPVLTHVKFNQKNSKTITVMNVTN